MYLGILFGLLGGVVLVVCPALVFLFRHAKDVFLQKDTPWTPGEWEAVLQRTGQGAGNQGAQGRQSATCQGAVEATAARGGAIGVITTAVNAIREKSKNRTSVTVTKKGSDLEKNSGE